MTSVRTALVVDDNEELAALIATMLRCKGFEVRTANNGLHGYSSYFRDPTDIVITDIQMPELNGMEMMRCIRGVNPKVQAVYMSGAVEKYQDALDRETSQFAAKVIIKPFSGAALMDQIGL